MITTEKLQNALKKRSMTIMKAKKKISMLLVGVMTLGLLAGCGAQTEETEPQQDTQTETEASGNEAGEESENTASVDDGGNTLVVYYSATGNTEAVANAISETTGGDLFELEPAEPYSDEDLDWTDNDSRVSREYENESEREMELVADTVDNWDSYDTVFIGYPIWWGIAAWPVDAFIKANDFTGKTVIPFATSSSSGLGESGELLEEMAGTGEWMEGERFRSGVSDDEVQAWVDELGIIQ